jgi:phage-related minor tail protein
VADHLFDGAADDFARMDVELLSVQSHLQDLGAQALKAQTQLQSLSKAGTSMTQSMSYGVEQLTRGMSNAFERFLRTGKLSFEDLKAVAVNALDAIYERAITAGLNSIFSSGSGGILGPILSAGGFASIAPRAMGGPVAPGSAFLVGEAGPEVFIPNQNGTVLRPGQASPGAVHITVNMAGQAGNSPAAMRQSASQIASQVSRAVRRAQRNG